MKRQMQLLDFCYLSLYIYFQDQAERGVNAAAYLLSIPTGLLATVGAILLLHALALPLLSAHFLLLPMLLGAFILGAQRQLERIYLSERRPLPKLPTHLLSRVVLYFCGPLLYFGSFFLLMKCFKYT